DLFKITLKNQTLTVVGNSLAESISGTSAMRLGRLRHLSLGKFTLRGGIMGEAKANRLGLGFCTRFVVTFDFANEKLYLKKSKRFDTPCTVDLSGLHIERKNDEVVVSSLDKESAAAAAGFRPGDVLVQVGDIKASKATLFQLRQMFSKEARALRVVVRHRDEE